LLLLHARNRCALRGRSEILDFEEIERFARIAVGLGIRKLRITGGERWCGAICRPNPRLAAIPACRHALTTNGVLLEEFAQPLYDAGLRRLNSTSIRWIVRAFSTSRAATIWGACSTASLWRSELVLQRLS